MPTGVYERKNQNCYVPRRIMTGMVSLERLNTLIYCACGCGELTRKFGRDGTVQKFVSAGHSNRGRVSQVAWNKGMTKESDPGLWRVSKKMKGNQNSKGFKHTKEATQKVKNYLNIRSGMIGLERDYERICECGCGQMLNNYNKSGGRPKFVSGHKSPEAKNRLRTMLKERKDSGQLVEIGKKISKTKKGIPMPKYQYSMMIQKKLDDNNQKILESKDKIAQLQNDDVLIGLLLSDADLRRLRSPNSNSQFHLTQKTAHIDFIYETESHLEKLGFSSKINTSTVRKRVLLKNNSCVLPDNFSDDEVIIKENQQSALTTKNSVVW